MRFRLGINYWPASNAMYWWRRFDAAEVNSDFKRIREARFDSVRIFLLWEDFQPAPNRVSETALDHLHEVADIAKNNQLSLIPTLFTGHMSGVNWLPVWALVPGEGAGRFRIVCGGHVIDASPRNWYTDLRIREAQALLAREVARTLRSHAAVWAYDLGNENSNCVLPPSGESAVTWLESIAGAIRSVDPNRPITIGLHAEDLEEDRRLGPAEAARVCDFLSMHGYPQYLRWACSADDERVLPFLGLVTQWLGGRDVLFEEFGAPAAEPVPETSLVPMLDESQAALFVERALPSLRVAGFLGAMLWCFADYQPYLWRIPPLDHAPHERHFGLWRWDHSSKSALDVVKRFAGLSREESLKDFAWIDMRREDFYLDPKLNLRRLYKNFRDHCKEEAGPCLQ